MKTIIKTLSKPTIQLVLLSPVPPRVFFPPAFASPSLSFPLFSPLPFPLPPSFLSLSPFPFSPFLLPLSPSLSPSLSPLFLLLPPLSPFLSSLLLPSV